MILTNFIYRKALLRLGMAGLLAAFQLLAGGNAARAGGRDFFEGINGPTTVMAGANQSYTLSDGGFGATSWTLSGDMVGSGRLRLTCGSIVDSDPTGATLSFTSACVGLTVTLTAFAGGTE